MKMADAKQKRNEQLKRWLGSETDLEPPVFKKKKTKVKFDDGAVFLAACSSGDSDEVLKLLGRGADINYANVDGLTALHQACIDDNLDMVKFLVENGANINQPDNEGWIPLHAAASCGYVDIAEYLISQGANVGAVNSEGETPLDIAEEEPMEELLQNEVNRQGIDIEAARKEEERIMLRDARQWLNSGHINDARHPKSGGTALHVAAAKGYTEVLKLLIQAGYDVNIKDYDGWTPLHAAAHWGKEEACRVLVEHLCDMETVNKVFLLQGQTAFDVADEDILGYLEELQKKQNMVKLLSEKPKTKSPLIESSTTMENNQSLKTIKNKETLLIDQEKNVPHIESLETEKVDEEDEGKKDESSCSSEEEEEDESESETEQEKNKSLAPVNTTTNATVQPSGIPVTTSSTMPTNQVTPTSPVKKFPTPVTKISPKDEDRKDESPASWRLGLRKTGSYGALAEITASKEAQRDKDIIGVMRSASSPRLSSTLDNKDKEKDSKGTRLAYVAPTIPSRRLASTSDMDEKENRDSAASLVRSGSYTRRRWDDDFKRINTTANEGLTTGYQRRSYLTPVRDEESESQRKARSRQARQSRRSTQGVTLTDLQEAEKTISRSRSLRTRDEEKEKEEKEKQDREKQEDRKESETREDDYKQRYSRSFEERYRPTSISTSASSGTTSSSSLYSSSQLNRPNSLIGITSAYSSCSRSLSRENDKEVEKREEEKGEDKLEDKSQNRSIRERRRPREKRRSTGVSFWTQDSDENEQDQQSDTEEGTNKRETQSERLSRCDTGTSSTLSTDHCDSLLGRTASYSSSESRRPYSTRLEKEDTNDYKKLYEQILSENEKLKAQLHDTNLELTELKLQLEKATQRQERYADRSLLEMEKRERRALERRISEMEEELKNLHQVKQIQTLRQLNERLVAENRALTRVVAKLSESCRQLQSVDL
ncbi:protein phosphatase 1 regulatory subunit 12A isoform X7 [Latimeria chalumnae]|uniref:protein phosphatase 1 regulatory subunit 12A isoform X7 n=1 Tax=Latimeria chalumnae TaxID=7897 RepID=UPI00313DEC93